MEPDGRHRWTFGVRVPVVIRLCTGEDLPKLEWFGLYREHREIIREAFDRQKAGQNVMLVADVNGAPVGQVWIDLVRKREKSTGFLWAVRVFPWFRKLGIGTRLIVSAEQYLRGQGYAAVELGVRKENTDARSFYERHGYEVVGALRESYSYTTPDGVVVHVPVEEWVLRKGLNGREESD